MAGNAQAAPAGTAARDVTIANATKTFGSTRALTGVDLTFRGGEIHALLGQNGAGKSTLFKLLAGVYTPDEGMRVQVGEGEADSSLTPRRSQQLGFRFVHQDLALVDSMTVQENVCAHGFMTSRGRIRWRRQAEAVAPLLRDLSIDVDVDAPLASLTQAEKAAGAIARAFYAPDGSRPALLVLDEPTAHLPIAERERLFEAMRRAASLGAAVVFSTHRLDEVMEVSDAISILRDGRNVWSGPRAEIADEDALITRILGQELERFYPERDGREESAERLVVRGLRGAGVDSLDLSLRSGEIVGLTGLVGAGHDAVPYLLVGATPPDEGELALDGRPLGRLDPRTARRAGFGLLPADRTRDSAVLTMTVRENLTMATLADYSGGGRIRLGAERARTEEMIERFDVRPAHCGELPIGGLSGGNQQKILLARWLLREDLRCLILHEPTQGVDIGAKQALLRHISEAADAGVSVLLVSTDNDDLSHLCDRVLVMRHGRVRAELRHPHPDRIAEQCLATR